MCLYDSTPKLMSQAKSMKLSQQILLLNFIFFRYINATYLKPTCPAVEKCGGVTIYYPFSTVHDCYLDKSYYIHCDSGTQIPRLSISSVLVLPQQLRGHISDHLEVLEIKLDGRLIVALPVGFGCWDAYGNLTSYSVIMVKTHRFPFSYTQNKFVGVGCNIEANMSLAAPYADTSCSTNCDHYHDTENGPCQGSGCCIASIPQGMTTVTFTAENIHRSKVPTYSKCGHAYIVEYTKYNFSVGDLSTMRNFTSFSVVLEWFAGYNYCEEAIKDNSTYMCRGKSRCQDRDRESGLPGYRCICSDGYSGNPYVNDGCQDINECDSSEHHKCPPKYICKNTEGSYDCVCPNGPKSDGKNGEVCGTNLSDKAFVTKGEAMVGIFGIAGATIVITLTYCGIRKRKTIKGREDFSKQNGGIMLQKVLFARKDHVNNNAIIFTYEQLKKATDNFSDTNIIGQGGYGVVYRGILANKTMVAIKKSKLIDESQIKQFINEVIILSQINHPNIIKLLGCCLETQVPLLVYEYITNNTLSHHIHMETVMTFETRLKIAAETAKALYYMNSTTQIIHRDVKPSNILLNENFSAKVSDFGISRFVPLGHSHLSTFVKGTIGYVDPEYFCSGKLNDKSDVFSFGVVLVELLTGTKIHSLEISLNVYRGAAAYLSSLLERNALFKVLAKQLKSEEYADVVKGVAKLAIKCLDLEGRNRPTMKEVTAELEQLRCVLSSTR